MEKMEYDSAVDLTKGGKSVLLVGNDEPARKFYKSTTKQYGSDVIPFWTDKKYVFYKKCGLNICDPKDLDFNDADVILLSGYAAIAFYNNHLKTVIPANKQIFELSCVPLDLCDDYEWKDIKYTDDPVDNKELLHLDPLELVTEDRLDIVIRYMACKEMILNQWNDGVAMYKILSESMNDCEEYVKPFTACSYFSAYPSKKGIDRFIDSFLNLIQSMKEKGFLMEHFIPLSEGGGVINGTHRIATALVLGEKVYAKKYVGYGDPFLSFRKNELRDRGFSDLQIDKIVKTYEELKK